MGIFKKNKKGFFTPQEEQAIIGAIKMAESKTSGEIKVHVESQCNGDPFERALMVFSQLEMHETHLRNGVLIYLAMEDRRFAIIADEGINELVPDNFWEEIKLTMQKHFKNGAFATGIATAVLMAGEQLKLHFPHDGSKDENEISDDISMGD